MKLRLIDKRQESGEVWSFFFELTNTAEWQAGQSIRLELPRPTWGVEERRFTIASASFEKHLQITTRLSQSEFKQLLANLPLGSEINAYNIEGNFLWHDDSRPRLMIAGGIGITPFRAMLAQAIHDKKPLNTTLIYSSSDDPPVFYDQLKVWQEQDPTLHLYYPKSRFVIQEQSSLPSFWRSCNVYVSGPSDMVRDISQGLLRHDLPESQLHTDSFTGV